MNDTTELVLEMVRVMYDYARKKDDDYGYWDKMTTMLADALNTLETGDDPPDEFWELFND